MINGDGLKSVPTDLTGTTGANRDGLKSVPTSPNTVQNRIVRSLQNKEFFWTIELVVSAKHLQNAEIVVLDDFVRELASRPEVAGFSLTDRVASDTDPSPIDLSAHVADHTKMQPLLHWSGKDRDIRDLHAALDRFREGGVENVLFLTGDKLKSPPAGRRPRYLESVAAIQIAREVLPDLFIAAALNPFKYCEEESMAQYLKLGKKIAAGADCIITQIGFDLVKHEEAMYWMHAQDYRVHAIANVMALSATRARFIRKHQLAGVTITDSFMELLERDEAILGKEQAEHRVMRRLALQIQAIKYLDYAGVQLTGLHSVERLKILKSAVDEVRVEITDRLGWNEAWREVMTLPGNHSHNTARSAPLGGWYLTHKDKQKHTTATLRDLVQYHVMEKVHKYIFEQGPLAKLLLRVIGNVERFSRRDKLLLKIERTIKAPLFGCETCGMCRLAVTQYICPETCPKGLANGACGGTTMNRCEYGDRECIHSRKYRVARNNRILYQLETWLIPAVPEQWRKSSSWPSYLRKEAPKIRR